MVRTTSYTHRHWKCENYDKQFCAKWNDFKQVIAVSIARLKSFHFVQKWQSEIRISIGGGYILPSPSAKAQTALYYHHHKPNQKDIA